MIIDPQILSELSTMIRDAGKWNCVLPPRAAGGAESEAAAAVADIDGQLGNRPIVVGAYAR